MRTSASSVIHPSLAESLSFLPFIPAIAFTFASGYRNRTSGALTAVGTDGDYWSSSPQSGSANAGNLGFNSGIVNPLNNNPRAYGFTVRCVQHLRAAFCLLRTGRLVR